MKQTLLIILGSALATGALLKAVPALAEPAPASANVTIVHTADLDLATAAGRRRLDHRLVIAAREVCGTASDADVTGKNAVRACFRGVLGDARAKSGELLADRGAKRTTFVASTR
jgi:UrcA family protein